MVLDRGICLGRPVEAILDTDKHRVSALVVSKPQRPEIWTLIPAGAVQDFASDTLAIDSLNTVVVAFEDESLFRLASQSKNLGGHPVLTSHGRHFGRVADAIVDSDGRVMEYHLRRGVLGLLGRRHRVSPNELLSFGEDFAVVEKIEGEG
jgi:sporulation protein YlmC with PRC-barrel domain